MTSRHQRAQGASTPSDVRTALLDAAEELFARYGYDGTKVRQVTGHAQVRLASINDTFGGKQGLLREVLLRRAVPLDVMRRDALSTIDTSQAPADQVRAVVLAFCGPMLEMSQGSARWTSYFRLDAQLAPSANPIQLLVADQYNNTARSVISALMHAYPDAGEERFFDAYLFMLSTALGVFSADQRLDSLSGHRLLSADIERRYALMTRFLHAGLVSLLAE